MEIFHVMGGGSNLRTLRMIERKFNFLISAYTYLDKRSEFRRDKALLREKADKIIVDSGFLSAAKHGHQDWANCQDLVVEVAEELGADRVSLMDIPMAPDVLIAAGFERNHQADFARALEVTYRNAETLMRLPTSVAKGFVNQGWTLQHREECHRAMTQMGVPAVADWWGMGSVALRTPETGLYEHARWCRENISGHLHCFGIAKANWVRELKEIGFDSCDSGTAATATMYGRIIANGTQTDLIPRGGPNLRRNTSMHCLMYWYNMKAIEHEVNRPNEDKSRAPQGPVQGRFAI